MACSILLSMAATFVPEALRNQIKRGQERSINLENLQSKSTERAWNPRAVVPCTCDPCTPGIQARACKMTVMAALSRCLRLDVSRDQSIQALKQSLASLDRSHHSQYSSPPPSLTERLKLLLSLIIFKSQPLFTRPAVRKRYLSRVPPESSGPEASHSGLWPRSPRRQQHAGP